MHRRLGTRAGGSVSSVRGGCLDEDEQACGAPTRFCSHPLFCKIDCLSVFQKAELAHRHPAAVKSRRRQVCFRMIRRARGWQAVVRWVLGNVVYTQRLRRCSVAGSALESLWLVRLCARWVAFLVPCSYTGVQADMLESICACNPWIRIHVPSSRTLI